MPPSQIRALIGCRDEDLNEVGKVIREEPNRITETINRYKGRRNERIRVKLSTHLNISYSKLWGEEPLNGKNRVGAGGSAVVTARNATTGESAINGTER